MNIIDLRSDTLTQPTDAMRRAMAEAEVGDDVYREDPTIRLLEETAAKKMGKPAALYVPSGTMANLVSVLAHCDRGDEVILGDRSHIFLNEVGGVCALGGVQIHTVRNLEDGTIPVEAIRDAIRQPALHYPPTRLIGLENTHNYCKGAPLTPEYMDAVREIADENHLKIHLDGARIFNAAAALEVEAAELTRQADTATFCLSKGLSAPVGSLICSDEPTIERCLKLRKMVGGGMRQAGHLAAAGLVALNDMTERLREDHENAQTLAHGIASLEGIELDPEEIKTNIIFFRLNHSRIGADEFWNRLKSDGVLIHLIGGGVFRMVLHRGVSREQTNRALEIFRSLLLT